MPTLGTIAPAGFGIDLPTWLPVMRKLGAKVAQGYRNPEAKLSADDIRKLITDGGFSCDSLHGLFGPELDPSNPDESTRRRSVETYRSEADFVLKLGGNIVIVHCSPYAESPPTPDELQTRRMQLSRSIEELGRAGLAMGVTFAFENLPPQNPIGANVAELAEILRNVAAPNTGMCFDTGHANLSGDPTAALLVAGETIKYIHFSDNSGQADEHKMPTLGNIDLKRLFAAMHQIGYDDTVMLELFYTREELQQFVADKLADKLAKLMKLAGATKRNK